MTLNRNTEWCLLIHHKYIKPILEKKKIWEVRTQPLFVVGERIGLGDTTSRLVEGYACIVAIKKMTVKEMMKHNDEHFANDYIEKQWKNREWLYALVLSKVESNTQEEAYPTSHGNPKVRLTKP